jgi:carbonic anhydrase/acetyltransferase-like protein (isoleucine patch superfamily)
MIRRICHIGSTLIRQFTIAIYSLVASTRLRMAGAEVGSGLRASGWVRLKIHPTARFTIGRNCRLNSGSAVNVVGSGQPLCIYVGRSASLAIADRVGISNSVIVATEAVSIGSGTLIGGGCLIVDSDLHSLPISEDKIQSADRPKAAPVTIGSCCFLGAHSIVLKGSSIGDAAVVGAGSVVSGHIPAASIAAGARARRLAPVGAASMARDEPC